MKTSRSDYIFIYLAAVAYLRNSLVTSLVPTCTGIVLLATSASLSAVSRSTLTVPQLTGSAITIDGDASDWPLTDFTSAAVMPDFPSGQGPNPSVDGDHLIFAKEKIGHFNGTHSVTGFINDATDGSDMASAIYMLYDNDALYILEVRVDNSIYTENINLCNNWSTDGFEFLFDSNNDSIGCVSSSFPHFDETPPYQDDHHIIWGVNSISPTGAYSNYERGGQNSTLDCSVPSIPGDYRSLLDNAFPGGSESFTSYPDISTAVPASVIAEIGASAGQPGYVLEAAIPFNFDSGNSFNADGPMGFTMFWRDRDAHPGNGYDWAAYHQHTGVSCDSGQLNLFNTSTWGTLNFGEPLVDCAGVPNGDAVLNECGECGGSIGDSDGDGTVDCMDSCPNDAANDADQDGICGDSDICPGFDDKGPDSDNDGWPDACDDCSLPGDINCDGIVNLIDLKLLALHWLETI